ncbi:unnamed protein product [Prorocentrum cordatum]|uniref:Uncharacterized protein n=1 Tax=Prorocentrum cordatum TaxID=2364126 RepID=A0ABN9TW31_9DINO|nr:unnamed protein product [Polarella glacialis]
METAELLAADLQLWWDGDVLWVHRDACEGSDVLDATASGLMAVWRFAKFSESRWLTLGTSSRTLVASLFTGIEGLVRFIDNDPDASKFYLRGFGRLKDSRKEFLVISAIVGRVAESFQVQLMKDSRVARIHDDLWEAAAKEVKWIVDISARTFSLLGSLCGQSRARIADSCIASAHVCFHFLWRRILCNAAELPWRLVRGDVAENLRELAAGSPPEEPVSNQLWQLMHRGHNLDQLVATVDLLGEAGWTSLPAEQQHASLAMLHKWHPEYGPDTLISRALLLQMTRLLPAATKLDREKEKVLRRMDAIMRAEPDRCSGKNMMVKCIFAISKQKKDDGVPGYEASMKKLAQNCFTRQSVMWAGLSMRSQIEWGHRAAQHINDRKNLMSEEWENLSIQLNAIDFAMELRERRGAPLTMSSAALDDADLETFARLWGQEAFRDPVNIKTRRATVGLAPLPVALFTGMPAVWQRKDPIMPEWAGPLIRHRSLLQGAALVIHRDNGQVEFWKMVFMVKSPSYYLATCRLHLAGEYMPCTALQEPRSTTYSFHSVGKGLALYHCKTVGWWDYADFTTAADISVGAADRLSILFRLKHNGGTHVSSEMTPMDLSWVLAGQAHDIPRGDGDKDGAKKKKSAKEFDELVSTMPWLQHLDATQGFDTGSDALSTISRQSARDSDCHGGAALEVDEETMIQQLAELEKARLAAAQENLAAGCGDFVSRVRGGESQVRKDGQGVHAMQGQTANAFAHAWAKRRDLQVTFKATFLEHGVSESKVLCRAWCHRMQHFYSLEVASGMGQAFEYTQAHVDAYVEPVEFTALAKDASIPSWQGRIDVILGIPWGKARAAPDGA